MPNWWCVNKLAILKFSPEVPATKELTMPSRLRNFQTSPPLGRQFPRLQIVFKTLSPQTQNLTSSNLSPQTSADKAESPTTPTLNLKISKIPGVQTHKPSKGSWFRGIFGLRSTQTLKTLNWIQNPKPFSEAFLRTPLQPYTLNPQPLNPKP